MKGRTVCHIYAKYDHVAAEQSDLVKKLLGAYIETLEEYSRKSYLASEQALYIDELEQQLRTDGSQAQYAVQNDPLTGVLNRNHFISHMKELAEREVVPTAAICVNINDWRFVDNHYGEEESDRLIVTVADILEKTGGGSRTAIRCDRGEWRAMCSTYFCRLPRRRRQRLTVTRYSRHVWILKMRSSRQALLWAV